MKTIFIVHSDYYNITPYNTFVFDSREKANNFVEGIAKGCDRTDSIKDAILVYEKLFPRKCIALMEYIVN
jgi:hypothetical protein